jgi:hypothetical protein
MTRVVELGHVLVLLIGKSLTDSADGREEESKERILTHPELTRRNDPELRRCKASKTLKVRGQHFIIQVNKFIAICSENCVRCLQCNEMVKPASGGYRRERRYVG